MRRSRSLGMQRRYRGDESTRHVIRQIMALPLLPANHIAAQFQRIANSVRRNDRPMQRLLKYVRRQWISSSVHSLNGISVHGMDVRTNNDCEGYHNRLRILGRQNMSFYKLVEFIHKECMLVEIHVKLVAAGKLTKLQNNIYIKNNEDIKHLFSQYRNDIVTTDIFLLRISYLINPSHEFNIANDNSSTDSASD